MQIGRTAGRVAAGPAMGAERPPSPIPLGGFWALLGGGVVLAMALVAARPATTPQDCSNYGGNGNASPFAGSGWGSAVLLMDVVWLALVILEQLTPVAWRHRDRVSAVARAAAAVLTAGSLSCCGLLTLGTMCH